MTQVNPLGDTDPPAAPQGPAELEPRASAAELGEAASFAAAEMQAAHARAEQHRAAARAAFAAALFATGKLETDLLEQGNAELAKADRAAAVREAFAKGLEALTGPAEHPAQYELRALQARADKRP